MKETNEKKWSVYIHTNKINNKVYIGITSKPPNKRWGNNGSQYSKKKQPTFRYAIEKYGWDNFEHIIFAENLNEKEAKHMETLLIALYKSNCIKYKNSSYGYNMTDGGDGTTGWIPSEDARKKMSEKAKERTSIAENNSMYGKHHSEEARAKMKQSSRIRWTKEAKEEASQKKILYYSSPENKLRSDITKQKQRDAANKRVDNKQSVVQLDLNNNYICEYNSINSASRTMNIFSANISACCRGKQNTAYGFKWMYKEEYDKLTQQNDSTKEEDEI